MFLLALLKTLVVGVFDSFYSAFIKGNINDIPYEETKNKINTIYKTVVFTVLILVFTVILYAMDGMSEKINNKNNLIDKQVAIIRECRPDYVLEKIPINK